MGFLELLDELRDGWAIGCFGVGQIGKQCRHGLPNIAGTRITTPRRKLARLPMVE